MNMILIEGILQVVNRVHEAGYAVAEVPQQRMEVLVDRGVPSKTHHKVAHGTPTSEEDEMTASSLRGHSSRHQKSSPAPIVFNAAPVVATVGKRINEPWRGPPSTTPQILTVRVSLFPTSNPLPVWPVQGRTPFRAPLTIRIDL